MRRWNLHAARIAGLAAALVTASALTQPHPDEARPPAFDRSRYDAMPDTIGTGPYPALKTLDPQFPGYVVYRPKILPKRGAERLAVLAWGNGACSADGASARLELEEIASHGYLVLALGSIRSGPGSPPHAETFAAPKAGPLPAETKAAALTHGIDLAIAASRSGRYAGIIDTTRIAVAGHSCGGLQAIAAAADPRVRTAIIQNSGTFPAGRSPIVGMQVGKSALAAIHSPILYILGGPGDVAHTNGMDDFGRIRNVPVMVANIDVGHYGTFAEPDGGPVAQVVVDWLQWRLRGDAKAASRFTGPRCGLCSDPRWTISSRGF